MRACVCVCVCVQLYACMCACMRSRARGGGTLPFLHKAEEVRKQGCDFLRLVRFSGEKGSERAFELEEHLWRGEGWGVVGRGELGACG